MQLGFIHDAYTCIIFIIRNCKKKKKKKKKNKQTYQPQKSLECSQTIMRILKF